MRIVGRHREYVASDVIRTAPAMPHAERLRKIGGELRRATARLKPDLICVERVFVNINPKTSLLLGEARGAALLAVLDGGAPVTELTALQIKQSVTGSGRAGKARVADMTGRLLNMDATRLPADCTDALACALAAATYTAGAAFARRRTTRRRRA